MHNAQSDILFRYLIDSFEPQKQATLINMYNSFKRAEEVNRKRELDSMKNEIVNEVLSRISIQADTKGAVLQIEELKNALRGLTQN